LGRNKTAMPPRRDSCNELCGCCVGWSRRGAAGRCLLQRVAWLIRTLSVPCCAHAAKARALIALPLLCRTRKRIVAPLVPLASVASARAFPHRGVACAVDSILHCSEVSSTTRAQTEWMGTTLRMHFCSLYMWMTFLLRRSSLLFSSLLVSSLRLAACSVLPSKSGRLAPSSPHPFPQNRVEASGVIASEQIALLRRLYPFLASPHLGSPAAAPRLFSSRFSALAVRWPTPQWRSAPEEADTRRWRTKQTMPVRMRFSRQVRFTSLLLTLLSISPGSVFVSCVA